MTASVRNAKADPNRIDVDFAFQENCRVLRDCIKADCPTAASRLARLPPRLPVPFDGSHRVFRQSAFSKLLRRLTRRGSVKLSHPAPPGAARRLSPAPSAIASTRLKSIGGHAEPCP